MDVEAQGEGDTNAEGWMPLRQAAGIARVHPATVRRWVKSGKIGGELVDGKHGPEWHVDAEAMYSANLVRQEPRPMTGAAASPDALADVLDRLAASDDARREAEAKVAAAEARLSFLEGLPPQLEAANAERDDLFRQVARLEMETHQAHQEAEEARQDAEEARARRRWWRRSKAGE